MRPEFATLDEAAFAYFEQHPELDPALTSIEFQGNPVTGYQAVGHITLDEKPGYTISPVLREVAQERQRLPLQLPSTGRQLIMTDDELLEDLAENGFIAYGNTVGWVNVAGNQMPMWHELGDTIRHAWKAAAAKIAADLLHQPAPTVAPGLVALHRATAPDGFLAERDTQVRQMQAQVDAGLAERVEQVREQVAAAEQAHPAAGPFRIGKDGKA